MTIVYLENFPVGFRKFHKKPGEFYPCFQQIVFIFLVDILNYKR